MRYITDHVEGMLEMLNPCAIITALVAMLVCVFFMLVHLVAGMWGKAVYLGILVVGLITMMNMIWRLGPKPKATEIRQAL